MPPAKKRAGKAGGKGGARKPSQEPSASVSGDVDQESRRPPSPVIDPELLAISETPKEPEIVQAPKKAPAKGGKKKNSKDKAVEDAEAAAARKEAVG